MVKGAEDRAATDGGDFSRRRLKIEVRKHNQRDVLRLRRSTYIPHGLFVPPFEPEQPSIRNEKSTSNFFWDSVTSGNLDTSSEQARKISCLHPRSRLGLGPQAPRQEIVRIPAPFPSTTPLHGTYVQVLVNQGRQVEERWD
ncbi:hypothetical protein BJ322DRAFT_1019210 [Thelephora terrestris]|uniref:Uncharacterized protein n=1 Tax=Thelephora terrestris TaxID=56493 RepID=A0A9P6HJV1_9AGAM|nr:hypothetical protein BJ322DRAFT_1106689 [Thelephora terrestris]KAF9788730.1 hypothetical protein BJ322DRAFT_1019210 [Thelephora terrestris]